MIGEMTVCCLCHVWGKALPCTWWSPEVCFMVSSTPGASLTSSEWLTTHLTSNTILQEIPDGQCQGKREKTYMRGETELVCLFKRLLPFSITRVPCARPLWPPLVATTPFLAPLLGMWSWADEDVSPGEETAPFWYSEREGIPRLCPWPPAACGTLALRTCEGGGEIV